MNCTINIINNMKKEEALKKIQNWDFDQKEKSFIPIPLKLIPEIGMGVVAEQARKTGSSYVDQKVADRVQPYTIIWCSSKGLATALLELGCDLMEVPVGQRYVNF